MYLPSSALAIVLMVTLSSQELQVSGSTFLTVVPSTSSSSTARTTSSKTTMFGTTTIYSPTSRMHFIGNKSLPHTSIATHYGVNGNSLIRQGSFSHRSLLVLHKKNRPTSSVARHLSSNDNDDTNNNAASLDSYAASLDSSINGSTDINIDIDAENTKINSTTKEDIKNAKSAIQTALFNRAPFATEEDKRSKKEIDGLIQKQKERDTKINRLKFQLTEFKESLQESEVQKKEMQDDLNILKETKKIVDNEDGTDDIVKIMQEKKSLEKEIASLTKQLASIQKDSSQQLQDLEQQSIKDLDILKIDIKNLKSELQTTSKEISKKKETDKKKGAMEDQIQILNSHLVEVKDALLQREKDLMELQKRVEVDIVKAKELRVKETGEMDGIKSLFVAEKEDLEGKVQLYQEEMERAASSQQGELDQIQERAENEKSKLLSILAARQEELEDVKKQIDIAQDEVLQTRQNANEKVRKQQADSKRLQGVVKEIAGREKRELKKKIWGLETIVKTAEYNAISVRKEAKVLKASVAMFEKQIQDLEAANVKQILELEERLKADEMFYANSQLTSKTRMQDLAEMFQRRMLRRKDTAEKNLEDARIMLTQIFDSEKKVLSAEKVEAVEDMRQQGMEDLNTAQAQFDATVVELNMQMNEANEKSMQLMNEMKAEFDIELQNERIKAEEEMKKVVAAKTIEMERVQLEADKLYDGLKVYTTQRLDISASQNADLRKVIDEKDETILGYEAKTKSFRQLAKLTWTLAKGKMQRRRRRLR